MATEYLPRLPLAFSQAALFGALVIVGLAAGEALRRYASLPRITGYVLAGAALGPHALGLISDDMLFDLRPLVDDCLSPAAVRERGLFEPAAVQQLVRDNEAGTADNALRIWALLVLELWQRTFVD